MRYNGLDMLRGVAAFGIVGCHLGLADRTPAGAWVTSLCDFNVGLFAAIGGFLMEPDGGGYVAKRAKRLLPTYLAWSVVYIIATAAFDLVLDGGRLNVRYYDPLFWGKVLFWGSAAAHLWFLICLFYGQIIFKWLVGAFGMMKIGEKSQRVLFAAISLLLLWGSVCWDNWYCIYPIRLLSFLMLGYVLKRCDRNRIGLQLIGVVAMLAIHLGMRGFLPGFISDYLLAIPVLMLFSADVFPKNKWAILLAATSMGVYLVHPLFARAASLSVTRIFAPPYGAVVVVMEWGAVWCLSLTTVLLALKIPKVSRFVR